MNNLNVNVVDFLAHISDIHIRYGSRHEEYRIVLQRTIDDLKQKKPKRIVLTGDLFHIKITMSPNATSLAGWFLSELSKIAPVDIILGNHDLNLQSKQQGNSIQPIIELLNNGYIIRKEESLPIHQGQENGIFFYLDSGFYEVDEKIIYGVYSCYDNEMLNLKEKKPGKKYIALYHGAIYGCRSDNGYELKDDNLMKLSVFNNFDIVMLGDIHEHQSFTPKNSKIDSIAYPGSLLQQDFGESLDKGYLIWNLKENTFERRFIPNDVGFSNLHISKGELIEERIQDLKLSNDPKKTKVNVVWEEYEEKYSIEKEKQIEKLIKTKYGCDTVSVECNFVKKEDELNVDIKEDKDYSNSDDFIVLLKEFVKNSEYENEDEVVELAKKIDLELNYKLEKGEKWFIEKMEVWNLYSFPNQVTSFDFNRLKGITGILGKNYNGKSNVIRALVWILYKKMLEGGESHRLVNMYTGNNEAGGRIYLNINTERYCLERSVTVEYKKDGSPKVSYNVKYQKYTIKQDGTYEWKDVDSEKKATEKTERDNVIEKSIGTFEDFTKIVLQTQSGEGNYLNMSQQPKNDLINKYLGLEIFRDRYDYAKQKFNDIKSKQKVLGNPKDYRDNIIEENKLIKVNEKLVEDYNKERIEVEKEQDGYSKQIIDKTKNLIKVENTKYKTIEQVDKAKITLKAKLESTKEEIVILEDWISKNFKKEEPSNELLSPTLIENKINLERNKFTKDKEEYVELENWIKNNPKKEEINIEPINKSILEIEKALLSLRNKYDISKGKKCPTCGNVERKEDLKLQKEYEDKIERGENALKKEKNNLLNANSIIKHNNEFDKNKNKFDALKNSLTSSKNEIDVLKKDLDLSKNLKLIKEHNFQVENKSKNLELLRKNLVDSENDFNNLNKELDILKNNSDSLEKNAKIEKEIAEFEFQIKGCKLRIHQLNEKITESKSSIRVSENNIKNFKETLNKVLEAEKNYSKYAIYLQAVHRDGIPARIIKRKLPIINHRINSILKNLVDFKIEMQIKSNGDIKEVFYFNSAETDALLMSQSSGAQKFIGSLAIRDSLHFVSSLTKPSLCIIDEGFGSLDEDLTMDMRKVFNYLKNKYQNILTITHKTEIKDFVDNIIQVTKDKNGLTKEQIEENPNSGVSQFNISY